MGVFFVSLQLELVDGRDKPGNRVFRIVSPNNVRSLGDEVIYVTVSREKYNLHKKFHELSISVCIVLHC